MVLWESYVAEGGEFQDQKRCGYKPLSTNKKSCAHSMLNRIAACGHPLVIKTHPNPEEKSVNEQGLVIETSTHSINETHGGSGRGDKTVSPRYHDGRFFLQAHADLSLHLTEGYMHNLTEGCIDEEPWTGWPDDSPSDFPLI
jgi:hypothetical protein